MNNKQWDALFLNGVIATMVEGSGYGLMPHAGIAIKDKKIAWVGEVSELSGAPAALATKVFDLNGLLVTPGLMDCHTHVVYAGNRFHEFEMRMQGKTYAEIAKAGGGILSTVKATREATEAQLFEQSLKRAAAIAAEGVTTLEIKSGYGLDVETELKILRVAKKIGEALKLTVKLTSLGAHALPVEYKERADDYIDLVCHQMLPAIKEAGLAENVDVFCETIGFSLAQTEKVFAAAQKLGLNIKCHAEQLSNLGASALAVDYQALSVDHLEFLTEKDILLLAQSKTVAVLLPGAFYFLREKQLPPITLLRKHGTPMAIATDCNPGTSPTTSLLLMMNMACVLFGLTPEEAWLGVTRHAAQALGMSETHGTLEAGKVADFVIWDATHPAELVYGMGRNLVKQIIKKGEVG